ncbi:hypothetical protein MICAK_3810008 [Microcystis aeruginosa PCC 9701]|uniref:Uncharacterized protein n=1 Tax=Microcystis aeruginosa PCC 9701 TaxID=721123 RepID=I4IUR9_MICAE|nr:hypothetical protein MICAK_3810008 [Microcystis aeruginosa PCC 9701]
MFSTTNLSGSSVEEYLRIASSIRFTARSRSSPFCFFMLALIESMDLNFTPYWFAFKQEVTPINLDEELKVLKHQLHQRRSCITIDYTETFRITLLRVKIIGNFQHITPF